MSLAKNAIDRVQTEKKSRQGLPKRQNSKNTAEKLIKPGMGECGEFQFKGGELRMCSRKTTFRRYMWARSVSTNSVETRNQFQARKGMVRAGAEKRVTGAHHCCPHW